MTGTRPRKALQQNPYAISLDSIPVDPSNFDYQTYVTIQKMRSIVNENFYSGIVRDKLRQILFSKPSNPYIQLESIYNWIKHNIEFVSDEVAIEHYLGNKDRNQYGEEGLFTPQFILTMQSPKGDCDDFSMLAATFIALIGLQCKFVTIAADSNDPNLFSHVYAVAFINGERIPFDASHGNKLGWEYNRATRFKEWDI